MNDRVNEIFLIHEKEDRIRMEQEIGREIWSEFLEPGQVRAVVREMTGVWYDSEEEWKRFLTGYRQNWRELLRFSARHTLIRVSPEFGIRKHTTCQIPYYHSHDFYEWICVCEGMCTQFLENGNRELVLRAGDACILTPGLVHAMAPPLEGDVIVKLVVPAGYMRRLLEEFARGESETERVLKERLLKPDTLAVFYEGGSAVSIRSFVLQILLEYEGRAGCSGAAVTGYLILLLTRLFRREGGVEESSLTQRIRGYIRANPKDATLVGIAEKLGYSSRHVGRLLRELTGGTFTELVQRVRMEEAAGLLNGNALPVEEIADRVGYQSVSGFYKGFRAVFHMTPKEYRKLYGMSGD